MPSMSMAWQMASRTFGLARAVSDSGSMTSMHTQFDETTRSVPRLSAFTRSALVFERLRARSMTPFW